MAVPAEDHLISPAGMAHYAYLIGHGTRGQKQGRLFAQHICRQFLQPVYRRVIPIYIIAHHRIIHGLPHLPGWLGHRIAS
ncbi:hypothetical protein SDC9_201267 [bioreactor metagenome]|uniref:Uncharacterized protein n=1 Tax=bioreactor metagenome TaxID=1076179 RepID=A0A645J2E1_9ZZZZ